MRDPSLPISTLPTPPTSILHPLHPSPPTTSPPHSPTFIPPPLPLRVLSHNIRYSPPPKNLAPHEPPWPTRLPRLLAQLKYHTRALPSALLCLQEVLPEQLRDVLWGLNQHDAPSSDEDADVNGDVDVDPASIAETVERGEPAEWATYAIPRDDALTHGEAAAIFWRPAAWTPLWKRTWWLNETGEVGRRGWDAASVRVLAAVLLSGTQDGGQGVLGKGPRVLVLNTHLDDQGALSRQRSAELILRIVRGVLGAEVDGARGIRVVLAGDLNSTAPLDSSASFSLLSSATTTTAAAAAATDPSTRRSAYAVLTTAPSPFVDVRTLVQREERYGDVNTFTGFDGEGDGSGVQRIDFVFVARTVTGEEGEVKEGEKGNGQSEEERGSGHAGGEIRVVGYAVLPNGFEEGVVFSDHRAVVADLEI